MYFFQYGAEETFGLFDITHLITLLISFTLISILIAKREKLIQLEKKDQIAIALGVFILFLDFSLYIWKFVNGEQPHFPIPMHLCSWATYLVGLSLILRKKWLFHFSLYYGLIGGLLSLLVPEFGGYTYNHMRFYQFFALHLILIIGPLYQFFAYQIKLEKKYMGYTLLFMFFQAGLAFIVNDYLGKLMGERLNMMFVYEAPAEVAGFLPGTPWHLFVFAAIFLVLWNLFYVALKALEVNGPTNHIWTEEDIPSLKGKTVLVTGGNSGLGFETVKMLSKKGAHVIMASRSIERGNFAVDEIKLDDKDASIDVMELDLASFESIRNFVEAFKKKYDSIDILINNAGIMMTPFGKTKDGLEQQTGVNHFGHFALTLQLLDSIKGEDPRIVNVASLAHLAGKIDFDNLFYEKGGYDKTRAYGRSKLMNLLFTYELQRKLDMKNSPIKVLAAHPGTAHTNLGRHLTDKFLFKLVYPLTTLVGHHQYFGAIPQVRAAVDPLAEKAQYFGPSGFMGLKGDAVVVKSNKRSHDESLAKKLWEVSEEITKVKA